MRAMIKGKYYPKAPALKKITKIPAYIKKKERTFTPGVQG